MQILWKNDCPLRTILLVGRRFLKFAVKGRRDIGRVGQTTCRHVFHKFFPTNFFYNRLRTY